MHHDWVLDVLSDLSNYARKNNLPGLAEQLDDTRHIAKCDIARSAAADLLASSHAVGRNAEGVRTSL